MKRHAVCIQDVLLSLDRVKEAVLGLFRLLSTDCQEVGFVLVLQHGILCHRDLSLPGKGLKNEE